MPDRRAALTALTASTIAFGICFAAWVINAVLVTHLVSTGIFRFSETEIGWLFAAPILTGALSRVPLGILTDKYGGRIVFTLLMAGVSIPLSLLSLAESFHEFLLLSLAFGFVGGSFAVGVGYVSVWSPNKWLGSTLGIFGMGNAGAAATMLFAPQLLEWVTHRGADLDGWRFLPRIYACILLVTAILFYLIAPTRVLANAAAQPLREFLAPVRNIVVWRIGFYYLLVFGSFVALAQWLVPYTVNVYELSLAQAGLLAAAFSLPSGLIRAAGGWMSDYFGSRTIMNWVFWSCVVSCLILAVPKMDVLSPGPGVSAAKAGTLTSVAEDHIAVGETVYPFTPKPTQTPAGVDDGTMLLPRITLWQEPVAQAGAAVEQNTLLARGLTNLYYPANFWVFAFFVLVFGLATGIGKAGVYRLIPEQFPAAVGTIGGMVGLIGALGGFVYPIIFSGLLQGTGVWATCWLVLAVQSLACLIWMNREFRRIVHAEAPDLADLLERRPAHAYAASAGANLTDDAGLAEKLRQSVLLFRDLNEKTLENLARIGEERSIAAQVVLFRVGDPGDKLYCILNGKVSLHVHNDSGHPVELGVRQAGDAIGEFALIDGGVRSATVTTAERCRLFVIERRAFLDLISKAPDVLANLLVALTTKLRAETVRLFETVSQEQPIKTKQEIDRGQVRHKRSRLWRKNSIHRSKLR